METVFLSLSKNDFQDLIAETVTACLRNSNAQIQKAEPSDQWFDLSELCAYLPDKPAKPTVYAWINQSLIPYHKTSKKLRFSKFEIDEWLKQGRRKTISEIQSASDQLLNNLRKRK